MLMGKLQLRKKLHDLCPGEVFFYNAINASVGANKYFMDLISTGSVGVLPDWANHHYTEEYANDMIGGKVLAPQGMYFKN